MQLGNSAPASVPGEGGWTELLHGLSTSEVDDPTLWWTGGLSRLTVDGAGAELGATGPFVQRIAAIGALGPASPSSSLETIRLLSERSAIVGQRGRSGAAAQSVGGSAWIVEARDGWFCINLARWDDAAALPALLGSAVDHRDWERVRSAFLECDVAELDEQAALLGLPAGRIPAMSLGAAAADVADPQLAHRHGRHIRSPFLVTDFGASRFVAPPLETLPLETLPLEIPPLKIRPLDARPLVIDLTSLWAGPLCGALLARAGCRVIKVEGTRRPDGARSGPEQFFNGLNGHKEMLALDFADHADRRLLRQLLVSADVVLEGSRPRVMDALGVDPYELVAEHGNCWVSLTAFGRTGPWSNRVGFGDDVAAQAGVVARVDGTSVRETTPRFVGDALADPVGGLVSAAAAWHALSHNRAAVIDVALREALAFAWADTTVTRSSRPDSVPRLVGSGMPSARAAGDFGADGERIRAEFGHPS